MTNELTFTTDSLFDNVIYDNNAEQWLFYFSDKVYASSSGFWRILIKNKIKYVSTDNGQKFGLPRPIDLVQEINQELKGKRLIKIELIKDTFDLTLTLTDNLKIEIFISSSGYESYDFSINDKRYIGLGSGDIAILQND
jgi:hypothetical protein